MVWFEFALIALAILFALATLTQIVVPAIKGTRMFPAFRRSGQISRQEIAARTQIEDSNRSLAINLDLVNAAQEEREAREKMNR